ncbi:MAG: site-2 protease family protein [Clostridiales bacterium]|nr:site-2 protease family protein [Clostridiales bacterium]
MDWSGMGSFLLRIVAVLLCIAVHEMSHGFAAYLLGDPTAKQQRRLSLNPLRHIDPFGALMMLVAGFGWAKPVPVDTRYFRNPKAGMAITALAGPLSNLLLSYVALLLRSVCYGLYVSRLSALAFLLPAAEFLLLLAVLSLGLGVFNLIPFPPLDGSKVLGVFLPDRIYYRLLRYERYGIFVLMALLYFGVLDTALYAVRTALLNGLLSISRWPFDILALAL